MPGHKAFYENYWNRDKAAPEKDPTTNQRARLLFRTLKRQMLESPLSVLDAGCGNGYLTNLLSEKGYHIVGIDLSDKAMKKARGSYPGLDFKVCSLENRLPFKEKTFDVVWSTEVIEHIYGVNRALKLKGLFFITTLRHRLLNNPTIVLCGFGKHFCNIEGRHIRFFSPRQLEGLFRRFGREVIEKRDFGRIGPICKSAYMVGKQVKDV